MNMQLDEAVPEIHYHGHVPPSSSSYPIRLIAKVTVFGVKSIIALVVSAFTYACFYAVYIPRRHLQMPVHFKYTNDGGGVHAKVVLENQNPYDISVELLAPDLPDLVHLGNFMLEADILTKATKPVMSIQRSVLFKYRSEPVRRMRRLILMIPLLLGWTEETIEQRVMLANGVLLLPNHTIDSFVIKLSKPVPLYSTTLHLVAHFTGLQHWMYYWFATSSFVGILGIWTVLEIGLLIGVMFETRRIEGDGMSDGIDALQDTESEKHKADQAMDDEGESADEHDRLVPKKTNNIEDTADL